MDATADRFAEAESRELVNQILIASESRGVRSSRYDVASQGLPVRASVAEGYERWASSYDCDPNPLLNLEERKLTALLPELTGKRVLDLACGTGRWLEKVSAKGAGLSVGVDLSSAMLTVAQGKAAITGRLAKADCEKLPFRASVFDLVLCSFAIGHIHDLGATVRELARVTKAGADVFVSDLHREAYARGWRTGFRDSRGATQIETSSRTAEEIVRAFYTAGFECLTHIPLCLGEPEKPIFALAGKSDLYRAACQVPAVLLCHFRRASAGAGARAGQ
jgi:ubiquinone/menaquinone biosynthesis C-methylase UbiE